MTFAENKQITEKMVKILGKRFCSHCQNYLTETGGLWKVTANGKKRWLCSNCKTRQR